MYCKPALRALSESASPLQSSASTASPVRVLFDRLPALARSRHLHLPALPGSAVETGGLGLGRAIATGTCKSTRRGRSTFVPPSAVLSSVWTMSVSSSPSPSPSIGVVQSSESSAIPVPGEEVGATGPEPAREDVIVQYIVIRKDLVEGLNWPLGSVISQGCHAAVAAIWLHKDDPVTMQYCAPDSLDNMHKVTLEVKGETQLRNLAQKLESEGIVHKLWIEQPENYATCLATKPYPKNEVSAYFRKLKLCK